ncbi:MAG: DNA-directed RNA polymerase subunit beta' [Kiritimatiellaeota bacterium]|nr:DNA-directed RNA polymerase subunit beta' [Kiritimatiellota bacterium]
MISLPNEKFEAEHYDAVSVALASPERIRAWSHGEVRNPETINYRTYRPEREGLFCEKIFGPTRDWECSCGKYKKVKHKGVICDKCGVEVQLARVRRERMGHIELAIPVSHIWFLKCAPSRIALMLDLPANAVERVVYYEDYIVTDPGDTPLQLNQTLTEPEYQDYVEQYGDEFEAMMGAEAIQKLLSGIDLDILMERLKEDIDSTRAKQNREKITRRMKICEGFRMSNSRPEYMVLTVMPVIPPDLRPLVPLEGGRFATSDLNDLYRRVINRNNRLRNLQQLKTPDVIIRNEKRMLQEAVDAVFDNGRHGRPVVGAAGRALKSLSDMLKGKTGRFRQNLLGKRVDYSGRSVIICGPDLKLWQCGLPKKMALVLFEPFIIRGLKEKNIASNIKTAKRIISKQDDVVWDILDEVTKGKTVMLNRAPTLHRLSIQSFEPVLIEGEAIRLHPLVCTAFNADFDGDQMAVHLPLSVEAQLESRLLMLASNSIFSPASGKSVMTPTQDIVLGMYYLTAESQIDRMKRKNNLPNTPEYQLPLFNDTAEVRLAHQDGAVKTHSRIRFKNPDIGANTRFGDKQSKVITTTVGRVFFNELWPASIGFVNREVNRGFLGELILQCYTTAGHDVTVKTLDELKALGFAQATLAGVSIGLVDMIIPPEKKAILAHAQEEVDKIRREHQIGATSEKERHQKVVDIWKNATESVSGVLTKTIESNGWDGTQTHMEINPVFMMVDSKARGSAQQVRQLAGMRGCMSKPNGEVIETPVKSNFREGLSVFEYFISSHGARKGLADTALKTADAGYLTRKLVDVSQDVIITEEDCNTANGIEVMSIQSSEKTILELKNRILGRTSLNDIYDPATNEIVVPANGEIDEAACAKIKALDIQSVWIRSGLTCSSAHGMCAKCYGRDLATGRGVDIGTAVGIIAAQSIGEPGTQLTMRTFHIGGTASTTTTTPEFSTTRGGIVRYGDDLRVVRNKDGQHVALNKSEFVYVCDENGAEIEKCSVPIGAVIHAENGAKIGAKFKLLTWDVYNTPIVCECTGVAEWHEFVDGISVDIEIDTQTGIKSPKVIENRDNLHPQIIIRGPGNVPLGYYSIPAGAYVQVKDGQKVVAGEQLAKTPRKESRNDDITGGLPRVSELFEARRPKEAAEIAKIEGVVDFEKNEHGKRVLIIKDEFGNKEKHLIPLSRHVVVVKDDRVKKGQVLTEGPVAPQDVLEVLGREELQRHLVNEVQKVYRAQEVEINDKHIEIVVRQMLRKVKITNPGDTEFIWNEQVSQERRLAINEQALEEGKRPAEAQPVLLGITKASLETDSFISAASFQDTTRVLTDAATMGRRDELRGFKENVILGHLITGGTGFPMHRHLKLVPNGEPIPEEAPPPPAFIIDDDEIDDDDDDDFGELEPVAAETAPATVDTEE